MRIPGKLGIDSICIDQDDLSEKNSQIGEGDFWQARSVLIWLNLASEQSTLCSAIQHPGRLEEFELATY